MTVVPVNGCQILGKLSMAAALELCALVMVCGQDLAHGSIPGLAQPK
jgi:hypothetical protein